MIPLRLRDHDGKPIKVPPPPPIVKCPSPRPLEVNVNIKGITTGTFSTAIKVTFDMTKISFEDAVKHAKTLPDGCVLEFTRMEAHQVDFDASKAMNIVLRDLCKERGHLVTCSYGSPK